MIMDELISMKLQIFVHNETILFFSTTHDCDGNVVRNRVYKNIWTKYGIVFNILIPIDCGL